MKRYIDLHMHSLFSDGVKTPVELLELVKSKNLKAFSITDHDNLDGYKALKKVITDEDPELISGVELSTTIDNTDMHMLAYFFDDENDAFNEAILKYKDSRNRRGIKMVKKLEKLGVKIDFEKVLEFADGASVGRPHVARVLFNEGKVEYYEEAFSKYIGDNAPAYVAKDIVTPQEAISLVHDAGGLIFIAHPGIGHKEAHLEELVTYGLDGIEAYHPYHKVPDVDKYKHLADRFRLLVCGGSDYHGLENTYGKVGSQRVPYRYFEAMKKKLNLN